jgi:adenylate cyclase class 2
MSTDKKHEVEIKFFVRSVEELSSTLEKSGFHLKTPSTFERNTLYDNAAGDLRRRGEVLRLRVYGERCKLTYKSRGEAGRHKTRIEHETGVASEEQTHAILTALGYQPAFRYEKLRAEWSDGAGDVVIDQTPIGDLGEIEGEPGWIDRTAQKLGLVEADYITDSYVALFFRWKERTGSAARNMTFDECGTPRP